MTAGTPDDPRFMGAIDVLKRTGAKEVQIRWSDDEEPVVWFLVAGYATHGDGIPRGVGKVNTYETASALNPVTAAFRLCERLVDGGRCAHCERPAGFSENPGEQPLGEHVCWWIWDPEVLKFVQGCQV